MTGESTVTTCMKGGSEMKEIIINRHRYLATNGKCSFTASIGAIVQLSTGVKCARLRLILLPILFRLHYPRPTFTGEDSHSATQVAHVVLIRHRSLNGDFFPSNGDSDLYMAVENGRSCNWCCGNKWRLMKGKRNKDGSVYGVQSRYSGRWVITVVWRGYR